VPVNAGELVRRLELYKFEEDAKKKYRRRSAGSSLTPTERATDNDNTVPFLNDPFLNEKLARSLAFHRKEAKRTSAINLPRPKSAYGSPDSFNANELTRRLEEYRCTSGKCTQRQDEDEDEDEDGEQDERFSSGTPEPETRMDEVPPNTACDDQPIPVPTPAALNVKRKASTTTSTRKAKPRPHTLDVYVPQNASASFSNTTSHRGAEPVKTRVPYQPVRGAHANASRTSSDKYRSSSDKHRSSSDLHRAYRTRSNDVPTARSDAPASGIMAEAALYDQLRQSKNGAKKLTRQERQLLVADRMVNEDGKNTGKRRESTDTRPSAAIEQLVGRMSMDTEEAAPPLPRNAHLEGYRHDWSQADAETQKPGMLEGLVRTISRRRGSQAATEREAQTAPEPSAEHMRWREKAMREKAIMEARAKKKELEKTRVAEGDRPTASSTRSSARSREGVHRARSNKPDRAVLPDVTPDQTRNMTPESLEMLKRQQEWLKRRTLEESALEEMAQALPRAVADEPTNEPAPESVRAHSILQQEEEERAARRAERNRLRRQRHEPIQPKMEMEIETEKAVNTGRQKKRGCFGFLRGSS